MRVIKNNIAIYQEGDSSKRTILFVHGFPYDHSMWDDQVSSLSLFYNCVTYDVRGLGESPAGDGQFTMESFTDDVEYIIDNLRLNKPVLCGLSMGGYISLRAVERFEHKLGGLILCDTKSQADDNEGKFKRAASIAKINKEGLESFVNDFVPNCFAPQSVEALGISYNEILERSASYDPAGVKGCILAMLGRNDTTGYLHKIKIPTLVLCGEYDRLTPTDSMKFLADKIKGSRFVIIPNAGHMTPVENPDAVTGAIKKFMSDNFADK